MSKRYPKKKRGGYTQPTTARPTRVANEAAPDFLSNGELVWQAMKTYLQEQVAVIRPQVSHSEMAHLARFGVTAGVAVSLRAESLRQVDFVLADADRKEIKPSTPKAKAIQEAMSNNFSAIIERAEWSYCYYGEVLLRRLKAQNGNLSGFQWINNNFYMKDTDFYAGLKGFRVRAVWDSDINPDLDYISVEDSVYMHTLDFFDDFGGIGPVERAYVQAATETEISATQLQFFRNMAMPNFIMQPAEGDGYRVGIDAKNELTEYMRRMGQGAANSGRAMISPTRWDVLKLQQDFDKLGMPELTEQAQSAVLRSLRVPIELLAPNQTAQTTGKFYDQKREWLISWLVPQAERYADIFTEQVTKPLDYNLRIVPNFDRVRGLEQEIGSRTETVSKQVADTLLDLYSAQMLLGIDPDPHLKGLYMVQQVPVPAEFLRDYFRIAPGNPGAFLGAELGGEPKQTIGASGRKPNEGTPNTPDEAKGKKAIPYLSEMAYKEWKNWRFIVERKGTSYEFEAKSLPNHAVAFGRMFLSASGSTDEAWDSIREQATKGYDETEAAYRSSLYNMMSDAFDGSLDRYKFGVTGRSEIDQAFMSAFSNGLKDGGVDPREMTAEEREIVDLETKAERGYWTNLAQEMFQKVVPLKGTDDFPAARDSMLNRIELWVNKGLRRMFEQGKTYAHLNAMKVWIYNGDKNHCETCRLANGQVHRAKSWLKTIMPLSSKCICGGFRCGCILMDTTEPARGSLASIPLAASKSDDHSEFIADATVDVTDVSAEAV